MLRGARSITQLKVDEIDREIALLIYVWDMATPRAIIKVAYLIRQRGMMPLKILVDESVNVVLIDLKRTWSGNVHII